MFLYHQWLKLPLATRQTIALNFSILKVGPTEVFNDTIKSDGYLIEDIEEKLNVPAIQAFLGTGETDMAKLWETLIARIEGREPIIVEEEEIPDEDTSYAPSAFSVEDTSSTTTETPFSVAAPSTPTKSKKKGRPKRHK